MSFLGSRLEKQMSYLSPGLLFQLIAFDSGLLRTKSKTARLSAY